MRPKGLSLLPGPPKAASVSAFPQSILSVTKTKHTVFYALLPNKGTIWTCGPHPPPFPHEVQLGDLYIAAFTDPQV